MYLARRQRRARGMQESESLFIWQSVSVPYGEDIDCMSMGKCEKSVRHMGISEERARLPIRGRFLL